MSTKTFASIEMEKTLIGECFIDPSLLTEASQICPDVSFSTERHRRIFGRMLAMQMSGLTVDPYTVAASFDKDGEGGQVGGLAYLSSLAEPNDSRDPLAIAKHIADLGRKRAVQGALRAAIEDLGDGKDVGDILSGFDALRSSFGSEAEDRVHWACSLAESATARIMNDINSDSGGYIPTGIKALDEALGGGGRPGMLTIVAARPSMGKSCFAGQILLNVARSKACAGIFYSYEMSKDTVSLRMIQNMAGHSAQYAIERYAEGFGAPWESIDRAVAELRSLDDYFGVYDAKAQTIEETWASIRVAKTQRDVKVVVCDYAQLMAASPQFKGNDVAAMGHIAKTAKRMAKAENVWVILLSQLNRKLEDREDKRPRKSDIRASGEIEEAADTIIGLYRPVYYEVEKYNAQRKPTDKPINEDDRVFDNIRTRAEAIILKDRSGQGAGRTVPMDFFKEKQRFTDTAW